MRILVPLCLSLFATVLVAAPPARAIYGAHTQPKGAQSAQKVTAQTPKKKKGNKKKAAEDSIDTTVDKGPLVSSTFSALELRGIGPAVTSGRVVDLAVHPEHPKVYWVATASGGLWKTSNAGTTWEPIFDQETSYSIGSLALDPNNPLVVWAGTGENNSQRSVSYGDGVYRSLDGGKTWKNMGLGESEHIGMIRVDPGDSRTIYVASQGPLWRAGGDRGLYRTRDAGDNWTRILEIDEHTGVSEVHLDPRNPDVLLAVAYQRARRVWTLIDGGPGSAIYKSTDGGDSWRKIERGLPGGDLGRIGLAISPADPDVVYAIIEAAGDKSGLYRSIDGGESFDKRDDYVSGSPQYYQELVADPLNRDRVYSLDTFLMVSDNGGADWRRAGEENKHVDNHTLWIDPEDTDHLLVGCDGGLYESWDRAATWSFKANLPITQFYKIAIDNDVPFYNVYGGTQDNFTLGGPTRTAHGYGIANRDWFVTNGGDGFQPEIDPDNPDIVYSESQYGNLVRFDKKTGERIDIKPRQEPGEDPLRWNWDSPLIVSPHQGSRLYFAAQRVFRSDNRGDSWTPISPDLSRGLDRNQLEIMGKVWPIDAVAKNASTSQYGSVVALSESPLVEGLLYAATDDGLIQVLEPGQQGWRKVDSLPGIPELTFVADIVASRHQPDTVFAVLNNHKMGDFAPYLLKSLDRGSTWASITGDLPGRGSTWVVTEDPVQAELLFAGTEFGLFFTLDGGAQWIALTKGLPTISVRDLKIQERENDLVVGTFGRGFFVLDDYTPLRGLTEQSLDQDAILFPVKDPWMYVPYNPLTGSLGHDFYTAPNPPFGAVLTYYLKESAETLEEQRKKREKEAAKNDETVAYPSWDELRAEDREQKPKIVLTVEDGAGSVVRRIVGPATKGMHRVVWDLTWPSSVPIRLGGGSGRRFGSQDGPLAVPGTYRVQLAKVVNGEWTELAGPREFTARPLLEGTLPAEDREALVAFQRQTAQLQRAVLGAVRAAAEAGERIDHLRQAAWNTPTAPTSILVELDSLEHRLADLRTELEGDRVIASRNEPTPPSIVTRVQSVIRGHWQSTSNPTATHRRSYQLAADAFEPLLRDLRQLVEQDLSAVEAELEAAGAPWTPGRLPAWPPDR